MLIKFLPRDIDYNSTLFSKDIMNSVKETMQALKIKAVVRLVNQGSLHTPDVLSYYVMVPDYIQFAIKMKVMML